LEEYGVFTVRQGEVEHWLPSLNVKAHKSVWISEMFKKMGVSPTEPGYLTPSNDDVWMFMDRINKWMSNEDRKGIPK